MKREDIEKLLKENGIADDKLKAAVDKVMDINGVDIEAEKARTTAKAGELVKANETITGLKDTIAKAGAEDIEGLKNSAKEWEDKYNADIAAEQKKASDLVKQYGLKDALKSKGVKDPEYLIFKHGGIEKFSFSDEGNPVGLDDVLTSYKDSLPDQFSDPEKPSEEGKVRSSGGEHIKSGVQNDLDSLLAGVRQGAGLPEKKEE